MGLFLCVFFRCVVWTGDGRCFFYNPSQRLSVWEKPEDLQNRPDVDKLLANKPDPKGGNLIVQSTDTIPTSPLHVVF